MSPIIPWYVTTSVIATEVAIAIAVWAILSSVARRSALDPAAQRRVRIGSALFLGAWLGGALLLAPTPASILAHDRFYIPPPIPLLAAGSLVAFVVSFVLSPGFRGVLAAVPLPTLHALQVWRVLGIVFVILLAQGLLPAHFALPAGWGDVFVGVTAPWVALALARRARSARIMAVWWNVFGLLDLVVAIGMGTGILASLLGSRVPPAAGMGTLPLFLIPTFAVPMSALFHVFALAGLRRQARTGPRLAPFAAR